jgi:hypothetical protein
LSQWKENLTSFFKAVKARKNKAFRNQWAFEHVYRLPEDHIDGVLGISRAFFNATGIKLYKEQTFTGLGLFTITASEPVKVKKTWINIALKAIWTFLKKHVFIKVEWKD